MMKVSLPWPPAVLNPNARAYWRKKSAAAKRHKEQCFTLASQSKPQFHAGVIQIKMVFLPPDKRRRDRDNMIASMKSGLDGVAQAWGVDDNRFHIAMEVGAPVKFGAVQIEARQ